MKQLNDNGKGILVFLLKVAVGILLLLDPIRFTSGIIVAFGTLLSVYGIFKIIRYFLKAPEDAAKEQGLSKGLLCLGLGLFGALRANWFLSTFPILAVIYGIGMIITGIVEMQWTVDMIRFACIGWIPQAISALFALIVGAILLVSPFESAELLWRFAGISIVISALPDVFVPFVKKRPFVHREKDSHDTTSS